MIRPAVRVGSARIVSKSTQQRRGLAAQVLRQLPTIKESTPRFSFAPTPVPASTTRWMPTFEELMSIDPEAFASRVVLVDDRYASTSAFTLEQYDAKRSRHKPRTRDPDGLPWSTDGTVLDGESLTEPPFSFDFASAATPATTKSMLLSPRVHKKKHGAGAGESVGRDEKWLEDVYNTPEWMRLVRRVRPMFKELSNEDAYYDSILEYRKHFEVLLQKEQEAVERTVTERLSKWSLERLRTEGYCLANMSMFWLEGKLFGMPVAAFVPSGEAGQTLPFHRFAVGTQVIISRDDPLTEDTIQGYVVAVPSSGSRIDVSFQQAVPGLERGIWRLDATISDIAYQRMRNALNMLDVDPTAATSSSSAASTSQVIMLGTQLRDVLLRHSPVVKPPSEETAVTEDARPAEEAAEEVEIIASEPNLNLASPLMHDQRLQSWVRRYSQPTPIVVPGDPVLELNPTQVRAIALMLASRVSLVQGPPGTGKTRTIVEAVRLLKKHFHIPHPLLVCTYTNVAVDNLVEGLARVGLRPLRFGAAKHAGSALPAAYQKYTVRARREQHILGPHIDRHIAAGEKLARELGKLRTRERELRPSSVEKMRVQRVIKIKSAERQQLRNTVFKLERLLMQEIIDDSDVVCTTCISAGSSSLQVADFPIVFLDEASMSTEPASLIPLMRGCEHVALIGDHKQLPPVITSDEAEEGGLGRSLFERLTDEADIPSIMLDMQYRMHPDLSRFPASEFYNRSLLDGTVSALTGEVNSNLRPPQSQYFFNEEGGRDMNMVFLDHRHAEARRDRSLVNVGEARMCCDVVEDLLLRNEDLTGRDIGVIAPYAAQITLFERLLYSSAQRERWASSLGDFRAQHVGDVEVKTVDGFEGREKEVIVFSTVRNNGDGQIGFLADRRRLNVGLTRAKRGLFVLGSIRTLSRAKTGVWARYMEYLNARSLVRRLD